MHKSFPLASMLLAVASAPSAWANDSHSRLVPTPAVAPTPFAAPPSPGEHEPMPAFELPDGSELVTERYPDRSVRIQRGVRQDDERNYVNHGPWTMWDPKRRMIAHGEFVDGERHGQWVRLLPNFPGADTGFQAPFTSQATFDHGRLQGTWTIVDGQNRVIGSWEFADGRLNGAATIWYPNGQQRQEMKFKDGVVDGESTAWKSDGTVWAREFYRKGKQLVPVVTSYDQKQKMAEGWVERSNFRIDANIDWWAGVIEITRSESEGDDVRVGVWTEWHPNGAVRYSGTFDKGRPVGEHSWWHENGQRMLVGTYDAGEREGRWTRWHVNGQKHEEGEYLAGSKTGEWIAWSENGQVTDVQHLDGTPESDAPFEFQPLHVSLDGQAP